MGHLPTYLHVVCRFIGYWARRIHFWGQNKYSSILTGALVAGSFIMGHLSTYLHVVCRFIGNLAWEISFPKSNLILEHSERCASNHYFHYGSSSHIFTCCMSIYRLLGTTNSFLTGAPVAGSYIMGHPVICFACSMSILGVLETRILFLR